MRPRALLVTVALVAPGCGGEERPRPGERPAAGPRPAATRVDVVIRPEGPGGPVRTRTVGCGDPDVCRRLRAADFDPRSRAVACIEIYGGPGTARVTGRVDGRAVDASFSLEDGCAIARWERFAWLLGPPPTGA